MKLPDIGADSLIKVKIPKKNSKLWLSSSWVLVQALIDPVCFLTCYPQLLYNFVYRVPKLADVLGSLTGMLGAARFLFSRDLIIAEVGAMSSSFHLCKASCCTIRILQQLTGTYNALARVQRA